jgi:hypothetical protein
VFKEKKSFAGHVACSVDAFIALIFQKREREGADWRIKLKFFALLGWKAVERNIKLCANLITSHHFHELIEIDSARSISINFSNDAIQVSAREFII